MCQENRFVGGRRRELKKFDWILIAALLAVAMLFIVKPQMNKKEGYQVEITVDGELYKVLNLDEEREVRISSGDGHYNVIQIKNRTVNMLEADCKNQVCVKSSSINSIGENIVCLPHKVIVKIVGKKT